MVSLQDCLNSRCAQERARSITTIPCMETVVPGGGNCLDGEDSGVAGVYWGHLNSAERVNRPVDWSTTETCATMSQCAFLPRMTLAGDGT